MENKQPLLSICIPTYNRAKYLEGALINIVTDPVFDDRVEIVISDNASTDNTQQIGEKYSKKYFNVKYFKNSTNIRDENFFLALQRSSGKYTRLFNDTLRFRSVGLEKMLNIIKSSSEKYPLFFYQEIPFLTHNKVTIHNSCELISNVSFYVTWIANFGNWRKYIDMISMPKEYVNLMLTQVDWSFKIVSQTNTTFLYCDDFFDSLIPKKKSGYDFFEVFIINYTTILKRYITSFCVYEREKYYLFRYHLLHWLYLMKCDMGKTYKFGKTNIILFSHYWYYPYFYIGMLAFLFKILKRRNA